MGQIPLGFEASPEGFSGQYIAHTRQYSVSLRDGDAHVSLANGDLKSSGFTLRLPSRNERPSVSAADPLNSTSNYFIGNDPAGWHTGVQPFGSVKYAGVWPGIDAVYHGRQSELEVDFVVAPGTDPTTAGFALDGAGGARVDHNGDLVVDLGSSQVRLPAPTLYQDVAGHRRLVEGRYRLDGGKVSFDIGKYDHARPLVIDPVLVSSTYLGGGSADSGFGVAVDGAGNMYVVGSTDSSDFPTEGPVQPDLVENGDVHTDAFITKLNPTGTALVFSSYLGGKGKDIGYSVAVGPDNSPYIVGSTESSDFPMSKPLHKNFGGGKSDAFITKLGPQGAVLDFSTYLGGSGDDDARSVALGPGATVLVAGSTNSEDFPTAKPIRGKIDHPGDSDGYVAKLSAPGSELLYSTLIGGNASDHAVAIAVDGSGAAYVTGDTKSTNLPTVSAVQSAPNSTSGSSEIASDAFVAKIDPDGNSFAYLTYLGGSDADQGNGIAVDRDGTAFVTGNTSSTDFPMVRPIQPRKNGDTDAFVSRLSSSGTTLIYSTYLGGSGSDGGSAITVDRTGRASLTGATQSNDFPLAKPFQPTKAGGIVDAYVTTISADGSELAFSSYLGGRDEDLGAGITTDASGNVYVAGYTNSTDFPTAKPYQPAKAGGVGDAFVSKIGEQAVGSAGSVTPPSPARERRIRILLATTIVLFGAAIAQTVYLRRRRVPLSPAPAGASSASRARLDQGDAVGPRVGGGGRPLPRAVRAVPAGVALDEGDDEEPPLPLVAPVRVQRMQPDEELAGAAAPDLTEAVPVPEPHAPYQPAPPAQAAPAAPDDAEPPPEVALPPLRADAPARTPDDPAVSESWAEAPIPDEYWAPTPLAEPSPEAAQGTEGEVAVPDILPEAAAVGEGDSDMWQLMTVDPEAQPESEEDEQLAGPSIAELMSEDLPVGGTEEAREGGLSISELLDEGSELGPADEPAGDEMAATSGNAAEAAGKPEPETAGAEGPEEEKKEQ
jgi:hypothetical protein